MKKYKKGERLTFEAEDYNEAMERAIEARATIEADYREEFPYATIYLLPFNQRGMRYCIEVGMLASEHTLLYDIHLRFYFKRNWFTAARQAAAERKAMRAREPWYKMFGL